MKFNLTIKYYLKNNGLWSFEFCKTENFKFNGFLKFQILTVFWNLNFNGFLKFTFLFFVDLNFTSSNFKRPLIFVKFAFFLNQAFWTFSAFSVKGFTKYRDPIETRIIIKNPHILSISSTVHSHKFYWKIKWATLMNWKSCQFYVCHVMLKILQKFSMKMQILTWICCAIYSLLIKIFPSIIHS